VSETTTAIPIPCEVCGEPAHTFIFGTPTDGTLAGGVCVMHAFCRWHRPTYQHSTADTSGGNWLKTLRETLAAQEVAQ